MKTTKTDINPEQRSDVGPNLAERLASALNQS